MSKKVYTFLWVLFFIFTLGYLCPAFVVWDLTWPMNIPGFNYEDRFSLLWLLGVPVVLGLAVGDIIYRRKP